jgi:hypothetical protein
MTKLPGGEFGGAWEALAAAARRPRRRPSREFALDTTRELVEAIESDQIDDARRARMQAEVTRRLSKKRGNRN